MQFKNIIKKATARLNNPTRLDKALQMDVRDIETFAKTAVDNAGNKNKLMQTLGAAGAGALLAGGATALSSKRKDMEDPADHRKRVIRDSIVNALAGAAVGGAVPTALGMIDKVVTPQTGNDGSNWRKMFGLGVVGGGGAIAGRAVDSHIARKNLEMVGKQTVDKVIPPAFKGMHDDATAVLGSTGKKVLGAIPRKALGPGVGAASAIIAAILGPSLVHSLDPKL